MLQTIEPHAPMRLYCSRRWLAVGANVPSRDERLHELLYYLHVCVSDRLGGVAQLAHFAVAVREDVAAKCARHPAIHNP